MPKLIRFYFTFKKSRYNGGNYISKYYEFDLTKSLIKPHLDLSRVKFNENTLAK